jgi:hypothetical protein
MVLRYPRGRIPAAGKLRSGLTKWCKVVKRMEGRFHDKEQNSEATQSEEREARMGTGVNQLPAGRLHSDCDSRQEQEGLDRLGYARRR